MEQAVDGQSEEGSVATPEGDGAGVVQDPAEAAADEVVDVVADDQRIDQIMTALGDAEIVGLAEIGEDDPY